MGGLVDRWIAGALRSLRWLAVPVAALLFLQWPLREIVKAGSREANDLGQWLFALFVAASVVAATRANAHLASDAIARRFSEMTRARLARIGVLVGILPWALFILWSGARQVTASVAQVERFPDTGHFGYFIVKMALMLLLGLVVLQASVDVLRRDGGPRSRP